MGSLMESWKAEYLKADNKYENHVNKFVEYIKTVAKKEDRPASITKEDVVNCIGHYRRNGQINSVNSMESHIESVKAFYKFLIGKDYVADDIFGNLPSFQDFKDSIKERFQLKETEEREFLTNEEIKEILDKIDQYFKEINLDSIKGVFDRKFYYSNILLRIFIKLTLIAPAKKSVICNVRKSDFSADYRIVTINNVKIRIPNGFRREIMSAIELVEKVENRKIQYNDKLFYFIYGDEFQVTKLNQCLL